MGEDIKEKEGLEIVEHYEFTKRSNVKKEKKVQEHEKTDLIRAKKLLKSYVEKGDLHNIKKIKADYTATIFGTDKQIEENGEFYDFQIREILSLSATRREKDIELGQLKSEYEEIIALCDKAEILAESNVKPVPKQLEDDDIFEVNGSKITDEEYLNAVLEYEGQGYKAHYNKKQTKNFKVFLESQRLEKFIEG